jgi:hypothetical protein
MIDAVISLRISGAIGFYPERAHEAEIKKERSFLMGRLDIQGNPHTGIPDPSKGETTDHGQKLCAPMVDIDRLASETFSARSHREVELAANPSQLAHEPSLQMKMKNGYSPIFFGPYDSIASLQEVPGFFMFAMQARDGKWLPFLAGGQSCTSMVDRLEIEAEKIYQRYNLRLGEDYSVFARYHCPPRGHFCTSENVLDDVAALVDSSFRLECVLREAR